MVLGLLPNVPLMGLFLQAQIGFAKGEGWQSLGPPTHALLGKREAIPTEMDICFMVRQFFVPTKLASSQLLN